MDVLPVPVGPLMSKWYLFFTQRWRKKLFLIESDVGIKSSWYWTPLGIKNTGWVYVHTKNIFLLRSYTISNNYALSGNLALIPYGSNGYYRSSLYSFGTSAAADISLYKNSLYYLRHTSSSAPPKLHTQENRISQPNISSISFGILILSS